LKGVASNEKHVVHIIGLLDPPLLDFLKQGKESPQHYDDEGTEYRENLAIAVSTKTLFLWNERSVLGTNRRVYYV
jgi:hypothetical protein